MLLGWSPKNNKEILTKEEIEKEFRLENINPSPAIFDERKLLWMNGEYIRSMTVDQLAEELKTYDSTVTEGIESADFIRYVASAQTRIKKLSEFKNYVLPFIKPESNGSPLLKKLGGVLSSLDEWNKESIGTQMVGFMKDNNIRYPEIYFDLIGQKQGLPLGDVFEILGRKKTLQLLN